MAGWGGDAGCCVVRRTSSSIGAGVRRACSGAAGGCSTSGAGSGVAGGWLDGVTSAGGSGVTGVAGAGSPGGTPSPLHDQARPSSATRQSQVGAVAAKIDPDSASSAPKVKDPRARRSALASGLSRREGTLLVTGRALLAISVACLPCPAAITASGAHSPPLRGPVKSHRIGFSSIS